VMSKQPDTVQSLLQTIMKLFRAGKLRPLPHHAWPVSQAANAFRRMAQAKHIGKIVLTMQHMSVSALQLQPKDTIQFPAKASYLITGGLGGFALAVAKWLVENGAKNLVLTGRNGAASPEAKRAVAALKRLGVKVVVVKADVADEINVAQMFKRAQKMAPLRGIFHAAMVLDDGLLPQLTADSFSRVMSPKVIGAWNLHAASAKLPLDHFVMFSSMSALVGAAGQANYVAANCFLDALAHYRRASGLPALAVNWGAIDGVGVLARNAKVAELMTAHGVYGLAPVQATKMLGRLLQHDITHIGFMHIDWRKFFSAENHSSPSPLFSEVFTTSVQDNPDDSVDIRTLIVSAPAAERFALVVARVGEAAAKVLRTSTAKVGVDRPLKELGLDSLMAFELLNRLEVQFGISLPSAKFTAHVTINDLAAVVLDVFLGGASESTVVKSLKTDTTEIGRDMLSSIKPVIQSEHLLALRAGGTGASLFFIHPAGGSINIYDDLTAQLPNGFPVYGIQSRKLADADDEWTSIEDMANNYAGLITQQQPDGALRLAGFSVGGLFALATAGILERRGRKVSFVGMIDAPVAVLDPNCPRELVLKNLIEEMYDYFTGEQVLFQPRETGDLSVLMMELAEQTAAAKDEDAQSHLVMDWLTKRGVDMVNSADSGIKKFFDLFIRHANLIGAAKLGTVVAPVWLWRARASHLTSVPIASDICARITRGCFAEEVLDGRHFELMHPPLVERLAARLVGALAETEKVRETEPAINQ
jgi:thioesterase domain-containing protein/NAD(P)-dependent dehydrogenase (short-subunit alcohol dehydrogenase family)/acyl carrier protein